MTAKQTSIEQVMRSHPRPAGQGTRAWCREVAEIACVSASYVGAIVAQQELVRFWQEKRAREVPLAVDLGVAGVVQCASVTVNCDTFPGWLDVFGRFKVLSESYLTIARERGDKAAASFLLDIRDRAERAQGRYSD